jgi:hypothetical protein
MIATTQGLRIQLEKEPTCPETIAKLVMGRGSMAMNEISDIVTQTKGVTCLIPLAYPRVAAREGATVEMATNRLGVNRVISIMLLNLLNATTTQIFKDNVGLPMDRDEQPTMQATENGYIICTTTFSGEAKGVISLCFLPRTAHDVAAMLADPTAEHSANNTNERIADLGHYIADTFLKQMHEAALACKIGSTQVDYRMALPKETVKEGANDMAFFRSGSGSRCLGLHFGIHLTKAGEEKRAAFGVS